MAHSNDHLTSRWDLRAPDQILGETIALSNAGARAAFEPEFSQRLYGLSVELVSD